MADKKTNNYFKELAKINVNKLVEQKNGLNYLSWAYAWGYIKKRFPDAQYSVYENPDLGYVPYFTEGRYAYVKTGVTINGIEHIERLPVMNNRNEAIPLNKVTSFDVNKTVQRSLTKACARHGLAMYLYIGSTKPELEDIDIKDTVYNTLVGIDVSKHLEQKGKKFKVNFLSWGWAWFILKSAYPDANYTVYENENLGGVPYFTDDKYCYVKTGVTVNDTEYVEHLPVMDNYNQPIPVDQATSVDVYNSIQRSVTKSIARHGLGLSVYAGEDLIDSASEQKAEANNQATPTVAPKATKATVKATETENTEEHYCEDCKDVLKPHVYNYSMKHYEKPLCYDCQQNHQRVKHQTKVEQKAAASELENKQEEGPKS